MKKIATLVGAGVLLAATIIPALAVNNCGNSTTGPGSTNTCTVSNTNTVTVNNVNDAQIVNNIRSTANTGGNSASNNTMGGSVTTGNASLNATVGSVANINTTNVTAGFGGGNNNGYNNVTGPFSTNNAFLTNLQTVRVQNDNTATVTNNVTTAADAGSNRADNNTGPAVVRTGNASLATVVANGSPQFGINDNLTVVNLFGAGGNNTAGNSTTGPSSHNSGIVANTASVSLNNINDLIVTNNVNVAARTGRNTANNNTLGGNVTTGNASAGVAVETEGNINTSYVATSMGGFSNSATSNVTGPGSNNSAFVTNTQAVVADNWNNKCRSFDADRLDCKQLGVFNNVFADSDAGNSYANNNTGPGSVVAGWASLMQSVLTHLNDVVNVFAL